MSAGVDSLMEGHVYRKLILYAAFILMVLPFMTTFNETLTKLVEGIGLVGAIQGLIAPFLVKAVASILGALGVPGSVSGSTLYLTGGWMPLEIYVSWNCIGWQSFVLLALTAVTGLQGRYTLRSKALTVLIGLEGTFIVNIVRILIPTFLAHWYGYIPALIFHDYFGTLITILWMGAYWSLSFRSILVKADAAQEEGGAP